MCLTAGSSRTRQISKAIAMKHPAIIKQANASNGTKTGLSRKALSRRDVLAGSVAIGAISRPGRRASLGSGREKDLHHPAHQRPPLQSDRDGAGHGLHSIHAQRRQDAWRVRAPGHPDREAESSARRAGSCTGARCGRLQHGDRVCRRHPRDRRRAATAVPDGVRRHHLRQPRFRPRTGWYGPGHRGGRQGGARPGGGRIEYRFYGQRPNADRPAATGQGWGGPPPLS